MSASVSSLFWTDRTDRGRLRLTGKDRQSFLQGMVTNDVARLTPGTGCYAFLLDATGHVLADARVLCLENSLLMDVEPGMAAFVAETLDRYLIMEKVRIADVTGESRQILIGGGGAPAFLKTLGVEGAENWTEGRNAVVDIGGAPATIAATRLLSVPAFDVYLEGGPADSLLAALETAEAAALPAVTMEALRIEAGVPRFGVDIDSRVLAPETGQQTRAISYRKGCYIGQEIVARIDARGHTNRILAGFRLEPGAPLPAADTPVLTEGAREVGRVTSTAFSPTLGDAPIALGYIRHESGEPGAEVTIDGRAATVAALPFVAAEAEAAVLAGAS